MSMRIWVIAVIAAWFPHVAGAVIVTGDVTGGSVKNSGGTFIELTDFAGMTIGADSFDDPNLYGFNEGQNIVSEGAIITDIGRNVEAGEIVASHYIAFDPVKDTVVARIKFDAPIIGVATSTGALEASDFLMNTAVEYLNPRARGLERNDTIRIDTKDPTMLFVALKATSPGDFIRVFTERSVIAEQRRAEAEEAAPVPLPPAVLAFLAGLSTLFAVRRASA
jgi:hypothetical protein